MSTPDPIYSPSDSEHEAASLKHRRDDEPPAAVVKLGWRYHHIGVPTDIPRNDEKYIPQYKMYVSGFSSSPYGVEWMRFEPDSPLPEIIRTVPHVAFEVDDLEAALKGREMIFPPGSPSDGVRSAMIVHNGAPVELIMFGRKFKRKPSSRPAQ
jgi:hypothetical protein